MFAACAALVLLLALAFSSCSRRVCTWTRRDKTEIDVRAVRAAIDAYAARNGGRYPADLEALVTPGANGEDYLRGYTIVPLDGWRNPYMYEPPADGRGYRVYSFGKDGQPGGWGQNADIESAGVARTAR